MPPLVRTIETATHGRFLLQRPPTDTSDALLVGFHGYAENAERQLDQLQQIPGISRWIAASVQGLHRFYAPQRRRGEPSTPPDGVVASWMTRQDRELAIHDNIAYVDRVVAEIQREHPVTTLVYVGFSQGVATTFRVAVRGAARCDGVIALGGDIPPELKQGTEWPTARVLIGAGTDDQWYTEPKLQADVDFLKSRRIDTQVLRYHGGHEWTDEFRQAAGTFLDSILARTKT